MNPLTFLSAHAEPVPGWLMEYRPGDPFVADPFFTSRIVYYPASGITDWHGVRTFGFSGAAHCFVHVDCGIPKRALVTRLRTYGLPAPTPVRMSDRWLNAKYGEETVDQWIAGAERSDTEGKPVPPYRLVGDVLEVPFAGPFGPCRIPPGRSVQGAKVVPRPYVAFAVLETEPPPFGVLPWPERMALLFIAGGGTESYLALFGNGGQPPYAMVVPMGMHEPFDQGWRLEELATGIGVLPTWQLIPSDLHPWRGYEFAHEAPDDERPSWRHSLYKRSD